MLRCSVFCLGPEPRSSVKRLGTTEIPTQPGPSEKDLTQSLARRRHSTKLWRNLTPGWQKSLKAPQGCRRDRSGGGSRGNVPGGTTPLGAAGELTVNRQFLASSAYTAPRRSRSRNHRKRWRIAALLAWQLSRPTRRRTTHSKSLSTPLAKSGRSTRLASKSRVRTPRSHWRCRSNASISAACVHKAH
jgi:hypothetical protein